MGCTSSTPKVHTQPGIIGGGNKTNKKRNSRNRNNNNNNNVDAASSRFCNCEIDDGTSSFICEKCKKIKRKNTKIAKRAIKKHQ